MQSGGDAGITSKAFSVKASGMMNLSGGAASSIKASGIMSVSGSLVMLQGPSLGGKTAKPVRPQMKLDPKYDATQGKYVLTRDSTVKTTVDRLASHEPFVSHGEKNTPTAYSGGLAGGGGLAGAFSIISAGVSFAGAGGFDSLGGLGEAGDIGLDAFGGAGGDVGFVGGFSNISPAGSFDSIGSIASSTGGFDFSSISDSLGSIGADIGEGIAKFGNSITAVSYTHLTLPTICSV